MPRKNHAVQPSKHLTAKLDRKTNRRLKQILFGKNERNTGAEDCVAAFGGSIKQGVKPTEYTYLPPLTGQLYVSALRGSGLHFHISVMKHFYPAVRGILLSRTTGPNEASAPQYVFETERDFLETQQWIETYMARFPKGLEQCLPPPIDGIYPHLHVSNFYTGKHGYDAEMERQWCWILTNCQDEVRHTGDYWFFKNDEDVGLFKLAFS